MRVAIYFRKSMDVAIEESPSPTTIANGTDRAKIQKATHYE